MLTPEQKQLKKDYMDTFSSEAGMKVLEDLRIRCFKYMTTWAGGDANYSAVNEGRRQALLHIETMMLPDGMETPGASITKE